MRVALDFTGCKLNQAETEELGRQLVKVGCTLVSTGERADIYILNTCTVTQIADRKSRQLLRMARRSNPAVKIAVTGCYAERAPDELNSIAGVNLVIGNEQKYRLPQILEEAGFIRHTGSGTQAAGSFRTRAFIKIQDGCSSFCSYCIVPLVRGREKSVPAGQVIADINNRAAAGYQEIVLTGTEIGTYHNEGAGLKGLIERVLSDTDIARVRLSSLQPQELTTEFLKLWRNGRLCRHFHLSLQSGSDRVLGRMKRSYSTSEYRRAVASIREMAPEAGITTDVIVGFPGETDMEFEEGYRFCQEIEFARIHVFPYSPRNGTVAARMPEQVKQSLKKLRVERMLALARASAAKFRQRFLGKKTNVLWEKQTKGVWSGLTDNYIRVYTRSSADLTNELTSANLVSLWGDGIWGEERPPAIVGAECLLSRHPFRMNLQDEPDVVKGNVESSQ